MCNKAHVGEDVRSVKDVWHSCGNTYCRLPVSQTTYKPSKPPDEQRWSKRPNNFLKVNFDGAFDNKSGNGGWEYIIRDLEGKFTAQLEQ
jgi:hypothetical protein